MTKLDLYWQSNPKWYEVDDDLNIKIKEDAPSSAQESYKKYLKQLEEKKDSI
jgi:hypothetical protein